MRRLILATLVSVLTVPLAAQSQQRVSAAQLEQVLTQSQGSPDADLSEKITGLQLTERFSHEKLVHWRGVMPGERSQRALTAVADRAAFLAAPESEGLTQAAPDMAQQRAMMQLVATYVTGAIPQLPRFYATRTTTHFESAAAATPDAKPEDFGGLRASRLSKATVQYREGEEIVGSGVVKTSMPADDQGLRTWGVFGPILSLVLLDAAQNQLAWSHWEKGAGGSPMAVFRYAVPRSKSHYEVRYCCVLSAYGFENHTFQQMVGYHGEMGIEPATGTILRLKLQADLEPQDPISRADLAVDYSSIDLGGQPYVCPAHAVSVTVARTIRTTADPSGRTWPIMGPPQMLLNHAEFDQYHLFRGETRILSGDAEKTAGLAPDATLPAAQDEAAAPTETVLGDAAVLHANEAAPVVTAPGAEPAEISAAPASGLSDQPMTASEQAANEKTPGFTLRISARLVDINVVAVDKKDRPISDLKKEDFEIYDNGVKQDVRSFTPAVGAAAALPAVPPTPEPPPGTAAASAKVFSNRQATEADAEARNTVIFLLDPGNLVWNDLVDARQQVEHFLGTMPMSQAAAVYIMRFHGYEVLGAPTTDHAKLIAQLKKWAPTSQDLLNARNQEDRNRQNMEYVHSPEDMLSVNGNSTLDQETQSEALDPKMRELGDDPAGNSLRILTGVASRLAAIPGHKSLVWITSDNALVDWKRMSFTMEKHSKYIAPIALRAQEAMNNAHVSVYPLDASRLEANVINADIGNRNVELTPTFQMPLLNEKQMEGAEMRATLDTNEYAQNRDMRPGRLSALMQQDLRGIMGVFRDVASATGGRAFPRSNNMLGELHGVVSDGLATYGLSFTPSVPADGQYHLITVKLVGRKDAALRYRSGYQYDKEPLTLKERFARVVRQSGDSSEIAVSARTVTDAAGQALRVTVAGTDLDLTKLTRAQQKEGDPTSIWQGKLDIFLVQRDGASDRAHVTGQTVGLHLKPQTYEHAIKEGLTFDERIKPKSDVDSLRVVVVDVNSGRIGSVTVPASALALAQVAN